MFKNIYLVRGSVTESFNEFSKRITDAANELANSTGILKIKIVYTAELPPKISIIPFKKSKITSISIYQEEQIPDNPLVKLQGFIGAYAVTEALPVAYEKTWPDGEISPGACLLTLFNRKKGLDYETFIHRWHHSHTPLSLKIHPLWNYSRNVVDKMLTDRSEKWEGIVEEQMRSDDELLNPFRFFGNPLVIIPRMIAVYTDTKSFLDYGNIETYLAREVVVKS
jgi:hypothetical protein